MQEKNFNELTAQFKTLMLTGDLESAELHSTLDAMWESAPPTVIAEWTQIAARLGFTSHQTHQPHPVQLIEETSND